MVKADRYVTIAMALFTIVYEADGELFTGDRLGCLSNASSLVRGCRFFVVGLFSRQTNGLLFLHSNIMFLVLGIVSKGVSLFFMVFNQACESIFNLEILAYLFLLQSRNLKAVDTKGLMLL